MDEPLRIKRKIFRSNKASLCSLFWTTHSPAETDSLDSDDSCSINDLPLHSPPIDDFGLEQLLQQIVPAEPKEQQLSTHSSILEDHYEPEALLANSDTQPGQEPISPQEWTAICPGLELFPPCCTSVENLGLESALLQQCSDGKQGLSSSSPQHPSADPLKLGLSSISCCYTVNLGYESSSLHHSADPSDWQPAFAQILSCNQPTKNPCSPARYPELILDQDVCALPLCITTQLGQETYSPGLCPENPSRQKTCPLHQLNNNSLELGSSATWQNPVEHPKLEISSGSQEENAPQWCPTQQPVNEASSETRTSDRSIQGSSSPLHYSNETLELKPSAQQCLATNHLKLESTPSKQCSQALTRPEVSSAKLLPLDLNPTNSSPGVVFKKQPKRTLNSSRPHHKDQPRTNSSSQHHLADQSRPEFEPTSHQLMPDFSSKRHQPVDLHTHEPSSPRHHQANCCRLESSQCHRIDNRPRLGAYPRHVSPDQPMRDPANKPDPGSSLPSHNAAADQQRPESSSPRRHSADSQKLDSPFPRHHLEADRQRSDSSLRRHSADPPRVDSSPKCHSAADRKKPNSSSRSHLAEDSQRHDSSSPKHLSTDASRSDSSSPKHLSTDASRSDSSSPKHLSTDASRSDSSFPTHQSADPTRSDSSSPSCRTADQLRPDSFSQQHQSGDTSRPSSSSPRRHSAFASQRPDSSSSRRHSSDQQRPDSSASRHHSLAGRQRPDSCSTRRHSAADHPRTESSSQRRYSNDRLHQPSTEVHNVVNSLEDLPRLEPFPPMHLTEGQSSTDSSSESRSLAGQVRPDTSQKHCSAAKARPGTLVQKHHLSHQPEPSLKLSNVHCSKPLFSSCDLSESTKLKLVPPNHSEQHSFERGPPVHHARSTHQQCSHLPPQQSCSDCPSLKISSTTHSQADGSPSGASPRRHRPTDKTRPKSDKLPPQCSVDRSSSAPSSPQHISANQHKTQSPLLHTQRACGESSVLLSKVKALKENRTLGKQTTVTTLPQTTQHSPKLCQGETLQTRVANEGNCDDAVVKPESQIRTYLTESLLICSDDVSSSEGVTLTALQTDDNAAMKQSESQLEDGWRFPVERWEHDGPKCSDITIKVTVTGGQRRACIMQQGIEDATQSQHVPNITCTPLPFAEQSQLMETKGKLGPSAQKQGAPGDDTLDTAGVGGRLWRAESWDSLGSNTSSGSNTSMLTLAERVELNRVLLKERLNSTEPSHAHMESGKDPSSGSAQQIATEADSAPGPLTSDADCDSGVSLQDSEGCRSAPPELLPLSARHDQAKQLLQRARMKARSGPLRASHHLLPPPPGTAARDARIDQTAHQNSLHSDRAGPPSGSLSDSSSGDSSCGQRRWRQRGPSPSRVRFEDESARDAEARYLERQQQRQRRVLDSVMLSVGHGPLGSKPDPSPYVKGDVLSGGERISKACRQQNCAQAVGLRGCGTRETTTTESSRINLADLGTFGTCGSSANSSEASQVNSGVIVAGNQSLNKSGRIKEQQEQQDSEKVVERTTLNSEHTAPPLTSKGSPIWILPSRQRIHTERIRETYIGKVTCVDDVDSALDSTDTSDSARTDSEGACGVNKRPVGRWGRTGRPINRCALVTSSAAALEVERDPSQVCGANQGFSELATMEDEEVALNIAKGRSGTSRLAGSGIEGKTLVGGMIIEYSEGLSFPLPSSSEQKYQRIEKGNALAQNSDQELAAPTPKPSDNCCRKKEVMERETLLGSIEALTTRSMTASEQIEKTMSTQCNINTRVPVPPAGKGSSLVPHRKASSTGNVNQANHVNGLPNCSSVQAATIGSPCIPQPLSKPSSCKTSSQPLTSIPTKETQSPCLYPAVTSSVNPGNLQSVSKPQSKKERDMLNPSVPDRRNNLQRVPTLEMEGHEEQKLCSAAEREGSIRIQPNSAPVPEGPRHSQASSSSAQKSSGKPQTTSMPMLKGQLSPHRIPGGICDDKRNLQSTGDATREEYPKKSASSGSEGQKRVSRNSKATKHQKTKLGALSTNNCNNTQINQYQQSESLPAHNGLDKHFSEAYQGCHMNIHGGVGKDYTWIRDNSYEENLLAGGTSNMWQTCGTEASSISRELPGVGVHLDSVGGTLSATGISLSLISGCVDSEQTKEATSPEAAEEARKQIKRAAGDITVPLKKDIDAGEEPLPATRKRSGSTSSLKKFFSAIGQKTQQKLGRGRSASLEHIATTASTGEATPTTPKPPIKSESSKESIVHGMKKTPSLQSLKLVTPFRKLRKAASAQNLHSSPSKTERSGSHLLERPENHMSGDRKDGPGPKRTLSVEDIGTPDKLRTIGRVMEVFPDGTCQLELRRPPNGSFGFCISSGNGRPDTGVYIQEMADARTTKLYAGLLSIGDEILEVNEAKVAGLSLPALRDLIAQAETLSIRLLQQRHTRR